MREIFKSPPTEVRPPRPSRLGSVSLLRIHKYPPIEVRQINSLRSVHDGQLIYRYPSIDVYPARVATSDCVVISKLPLYSPLLHSTVPVSVSESVSVSVSGPASPFRLPV